MKKYSITLMLSFVACLLSAAEGFMNEHWSQTKPYNDLVPAYLPPETGDTGYEAWGGHVTAGCVATAMAQTMHYWGWPSRFDKKIDIEHTVRLDKKEYNKETQSYTYKTEFNVTHTIAAGVPIKYDDFDECKARLTFIAATLGELAFDRDGTGGYPSTVASALSDYYVAPPTCDDYDLRNYLKLGYPVPATITGHAVVLHGWKQDEKGNDLYYMNNGNAGTGDRWIDRATIKSLSPCFPKKMVMIGPVPAKAKLPLTVEWAFPEAYLKIYPKGFEGFTIKAIPSSAKDQPEVDVQLGREERSYTFDKLTNGETYSIEITPRFGTLAEDDPTVFIEPITQSAMTTIDDGAGDCPQLTAPKKYAAALTGGEFTLSGSKTIENITITPSLKSYTIGKTTYNLADYISVEGKEGEWTVKIKPIDFLGKSDNYNVVFTFVGTVPSSVGTVPMSIAYAETIVNFAAANKGEVGTVPNPEEKPDTEEPGTVPTPDEGKIDYILISPSDFVKYWESYIEQRKAAHSELTFAVKDAAEIYKDYASTGDSPQLNSSEMIKAFIVEQAKLGTKYFVLGGAWSDPATIEKSEINFLSEAMDGGKYGQVALSLANTIPGWYHSYSGKSTPLASDYDYALIDDDEKPDVVVSRIPLIRLPDTQTGAFPTFAQMIEGYGKKVAAVESEDFSGRHRYACAAGQLGSSVARGSEYWPTEQHRYADGYFDFFDKNHPDLAMDGEIAARRRFRDYFAKYNPVKGAAVVPLGFKVDDFFDSKDGWEAIIAKSHGLEGSASGTGVDDAHFRRTDTLVKFGIFAMPCLTGRPDWVGDWNGFTKCMIPSMGAAAICNPKGGEVVGFHNTHDGAGKNEVRLVTTCGDPYATQYEGLLLEALCKDRLNAGEAWMKAHQDYIDKFGTGTWHLWTAYESILYGDPLIKLSEVKEDEKVCGMGAAVPKVLFK